LIRQHSWSQESLPDVQAAEPIPFVGTGALALPNITAEHLPIKPSANHDRGLFPIALHQDPRYFVKGTGGFWAPNRLPSPEFITRGDDGRNHFNTSELAGNAVAAGISNLYYPAADSLGNTANKWDNKIGLDTFSM